jgi:O-antigen/teichoic acid export membrane protein
MSAEERSEQLRRRVARNALSNYIGRGLMLAMGFFLTPFLLSQLGAVHYGLWLLVGSVMAYAELFEFGITGAVIKYIAEHYATRAFASAQRMLATAIGLYAMVGLLVIVLSAALAPFFPRLFQVPASDAATASQLVVLMGVAMGINLAGSITWTVLHGLQRFDLDNLISTLSALLTNVAIIITVLLGGGVVGLVLATIGVSLVMQGFAFWVMLRAAPELRLSLRGASLAEARTIMRFGSALFLGRFAGRLKSQTDDIVIGSVLSVVAIAPYSVAQRLSELSQTLTDQFTKVLEPLASQLDAEKDLAGLRALFLTSTRVTLAIFLPIACGFTILSVPFLTLWVGADYARQPELVAILMLAVLLDTLATPGVLIVQGMARHQPLAWIALGSGLLNLALSIVLARRLGLVGVALGTLVPSTLEVAGLVLPYQLRTIGMPARDFARTACLPALLPAVPLCLWLYGVLLWVHPASWFSLVWIGGVGAAIYGLMYLSQPSAAMERQSLLRYAEPYLKRGETKF